MPLPRSGDFLQGMDASRLTAADYRTMVREAERLANVQTSAPIVTPERNVLDLVMESGFYATLSGSASPYSWSEKQGTTGGTWQARVLAGTSNAYEVNGASGLSGKTVWLQPGYPGDYRFQWVAASGSHSPPTVTIPGCSCTAIPTTLNMSATGPCGGIFFAASIVYGPRPADCAGCTTLGANCFLSPTVYTDAFTGLPYRFCVECDTIFIRLSRVFIDVGSGCFHDSSIYSWSIGQPGNTCSPFSLTNGFIYPGGDASCHVSLSG